MVTCSGCGEMFDPAKLKGMAQTFFIAAFPLCGNCFLEGIGLAQPPRFSKQGPDNYGKKVSRKPTLNELDSN